MKFWGFALIFIFLYNQIVTGEYKKGVVDQRWIFMFNFVLLIGRTVGDVKVTTLDSGLKVANMTLAVTRPFKNPETGEYDVDFVTVVLWQGIAEAVSKNCKKGSTVAVKGRVAVRSNDVNGLKINVLDIVGERVTFISLKNDSQEIGEEEEK